MLERAAAGTGNLVLIGGEPGVGKIPARRGDRGRGRDRFRVLVGHCYESGRDLPYMPWVETDRDGDGRHRPDRVPPRLGDEAPEFARLVPELRRRLPDIPPPVELPAEQQRRYTFNSIRDFVYPGQRDPATALRSRGPPLGRRATLLLLEHLAERLSSIPCLIIGTHRDPPSDLTPQLADTMGRLVRQRQTRRLNLYRHSEHEVEALLRALGEQAPPAKVRGSSTSETDGNAFFVEEVFRHLAERRPATRRARTVPDRPRHRRARRARPTSGS